MKIFYPNGFTLVELTTVMAIAGIILSVAVPSFTTLTQNTRLSTQVNELVTSINKARAEAGRRGVRVVLCRSDDVIDSTPTCGGATNNWSTGWLVYVVGTARTVPLFDASQNDVLLGKSVPESGVTILTTNGANQNIEFNPDGTTNESGRTLLIAFCDNRGVSNGRLITIRPIGNPQLTNASTCTPT